MTFEVDENLIGIWFVTLPKGDWMGAMSRVPGDRDRFQLTYRFRWYRGPGVFDDSKDEKNWWRMEADNIAKGVDVMHAAASVMADRAKRSGEKGIGEMWELLRGTGTVEQFMKQLLKLPFIHHKKVSAEEAKRYINEVFKPL